MISPHGGLIDDNDIILSEVINFVHINSDA